MNQMKGMYFKTLNENEYEVVVYIGLLSQIFSEDASARVISILEKVDNHYWSRRSQRGRIYVETSMRAPVRTSRVEVQVEINDAVFCDLSYRGPDRLELVTMTKEQEDEFYINPELKTNMPIPAHFTECFQRLRVEIEYSGFKFQNWIEDRERKYLCGLPFGSRILFEKLARVAVAQNARHRDIRKQNLFATFLENKVLSRSNLWFSDGVQNNNDMMINWLAFSKMRFEEKIALFFCSHGVITTHVDNCGWRLLLHEKFHRTLFCDDDEERRQKAFSDARFWAVPNANNESKWGYTSYRVRQAKNDKGADPTTDDVFKWVVCCCYFADRSNSSHEVHAMRSFYRESDTGLIRRKQVKVMNRDMSLEQLSVRIGVTLRVIEIRKKMHELGLVEERQTLKLQLAKIWEANKWLHPFLIRLDYSNLLLNYNKSDTPPKNMPKYPCGVM